MFRRARLGVPERSVGGPSRARQDCFRRRWPIPERTVRPRGVVMAAPLLNQHLDLPERVEHLNPQQFVAQLAVEALHITITGHADPGVRVSRCPWAADYGATIRDTGHREHVECGQAVRWK